MASRTRQELKTRSIELIHTSQRPLKTMEVVEALRKEFGNHRITAHKVAKFLVSAFPEIQYSRRRGWFSINWEEENLISLDD